MGTLDARPLPRQVLLRLARAGGAEHAVAGVRNRARPPVFWPRPWGRLTRTEITPGRCRTTIDCLVVLGTHCLMAPSGPWSVHGETGGKAAQDAPTVTEQASLGTRNEGTGVLPSGNASYLRSSRMTALAHPAVLRDTAAQKTQRPNPTELCLRGTGAQEGVMSDDNLSVPKQNPA